MRNSKKRLALFASGRGSNGEALYKAMQEEGINSFSWEVLEVCPQEELNNKNIKQFNLIDVYSDEKLGDKESITIRFVLQNDEKTMEEEDITTTMNSILEILEQKLSIGLR